MRPLLALLALLAALTLAACGTGPETELDCGDTGTSPNMTVPEDDPHDLDTDGDGIGCETPDA